MRCQEIKNSTENIVIGVDKNVEMIKQYKFEIETDKTTIESDKIFVEQAKQDIINTKNLIDRQALEVENNTKEVNKTSESVNTTYKNFQQDLGNRVATLESGKIPVSQIPRIAITETKTFKTTVERDEWINSEEGDIAIISDENKTYIKNSENNWVLLESPSDYSTNSGHATTADNASNSSKINGKSIVYMTQDEFDSAYNSDILLEDTYYFVK